MTSNIKRGALIGCGFFADNHLHAWRELQGVDIVAVCDLDAKRAGAAASKFGVPAAYSDIAELLAGETLDFVDVATTVEAHRTLVEAAAPFVRTVICQKPFAETLADARAMVDACERTGATLMVHENFRWLHSFRTMKSIVDGGEIGTPRFARFSFRHGHDHYRDQPYLLTAERFALLDVGLHLFDLARHFMGDVVRLSCTTQRLNPRVAGEDAFTALLAHTSGATTVCDCSFDTTLRPEPFPETAAWVEGERGTLELDRRFGLTVHAGTGARRIDVEPSVPTWGARPWHAAQASVAAFQAHALQVMHGRAAAQPSGHHNLDTLALALAAYEAADEGRTIDMRTWTEPSRARRVSASSRTPGS